jgi:hypothetical protein
MADLEHQPFSSVDKARSNTPDILARLEKAVGTIQDSDTFRAYLDVQSRFHRYSPNNIILILTQRPDATQVAGYNAWLQMHRYVKRGERAIKIIVPMTKKVINTDGEEEHKLIFGTGNVFDYSQTDGEPLPTVEVPVLAGEEGAELYQRLAYVVASENLALQAGDPDKLRREQMGYYSPRERLIVVRESPMLQQTKTLAHELGHHFAGHGAEGDTSLREEQETVAESVSYITLAHFGLDSGERAFPYIATWSRDQKLLRHALGTIQRVSATMIDRVEGRSGEEQPQLS